MKRKEAGRVLKIGVLSTAVLLIIMMSSCGERGQDQNTPAGQTLSCQLTIQCETALESDRLSDGTRKILPEDGIIYEEKEVPFEEGDSVYDVLKQEVRKNKIHMESAESPIYKSEYVEGISNLYEFDCGDRSGWMYKVNDEFPKMGCSKCKVKENDRIYWIYSCNLGKDIGGGNFK